MAGVRGWAISEGRARGACCRCDGPRLNRRPSRIDGAHYGKASHEAVRQILLGLSLRSRGRLCLLLLLEEVLLVQVRRRNVFAHFRQYASSVRIVPPCCDLKNLHTGISVPVVDVERGEVNQGRNITRISGFIEPRRRTVDGVAIRNLAIQRHLTDHIPGSGISGCAPLLERQCMIAFVVGINSALVIVGIGCRGETA